MASFSDIDSSKQQILQDKCYEEFHTGDRLFIKYLNPRSAFGFCQFKFDIMTSGKYLPGYSVRTEMTEHIYLNEKRSCSCETRILIK